MSDFEKLKQQIKHYKNERLKEWDEEVKKETSVNYFVINYCKGFVCALSLVEGMIAEIESEEEKR